MQKAIPERIIIARTDSIGDVILTLPMCGVIKDEKKGCEIIFIGRSYTKAIVEACAHIDYFINWDEVEKKNPRDQIAELKSWNATSIIHVFPRKEITWVAKRAGIPLRVGTGRRWYTISKCNKLVFFSRRKSPLHESQLNLKLLEGIGIFRSLTLSEIPSYYGLHAKAGLPANIQSLLQQNRLKVILHPLSKGSAVNWGLDHFEKLINSLAHDPFEIFVTGTETEGRTIRERITFSQSNLHDMTGKMNLVQLISFINGCDALVAASTGPLHIAAALGKKAIGLYTPLRPMHAGRWGAIGNYAENLIASEHPDPGLPLNITPQKVADRLLLFLAEKQESK